MHWNIFKTCYMNINLVEMVYDLEMHQESNSQYQEPSVIHLQTGVSAWQVQNYGTIYHTLLELSIILILPRQNLWPICLMRHLTNQRHLKYVFILCFYHYWIFITCYIIKVPLHVTHYTQNVYSTMKTIIIVEDWGSIKAKKLKFYIMFSQSWYFYSAEWPNKAASTSRYTHI